MAVEVWAAAMMSSVSNEPGASDPMLLFVGVSW
jgi:hypothetical protein